MENQVYRGQDNAIMYLRRYYTTHPCIYNLRFFPFDQQRCKIIFKMRTATTKTVRIKPNGVKYSATRNLVDFIVTDLYLTPGTANTSRSEAWLFLDFAREPLYHISQTFFQSFLLSFLGYLTFYINIEDFTDRFIGSLTCLLVLASLLGSMTASLPSTSYFKAVFPVALHGQYNDSTKIRFQAN